MSACAIGVDVGGTKIAVGVLGEGGLQTVSRVPTETSSSSALVEQLAGLIRAAAGGRPAVAGVGVPSVVELETGCVRSSVNIPLRDVPLRSVLGERLGIPVTVDNDATCAAFAEAHDASHRQVARDLVTITVGTGVGGGLVLNGSVYRGPRGGAGELGHMLIADCDSGERGVAVSFPQPGSLEALASGHALDRMATEAAGSFPGSVLGEMLAKQGTVSGKDVTDGALAGDEQCRGLLALLGARLGVGIANAINIFEPEEVVIGGGVAAAGGALLDPAAESARRLVLPGLGTRTTIRLARHGSDAGMLGAALLAACEQRHDARSPAPEVVTGR